MRILNCKIFFFQIEDMSQAVGLRVLDVIKFFFLLLLVTTSSTHVEKHTCSIMGVMGPFWAIPKVLLQLIRSITGRKGKKNKPWAEESAVVNSVALCVVSVGQASDQCWVFVCVCVFKTYCSCHILQYFISGYMHTYTFTHNRFPVDLLDKRWKTKTVRLWNSVKQIYSAWQLTVTSNCMDCGVCVCVRWGKMLLMSCFFIHTQRHTHTRTYFHH